MLELLNFMIKFCSIQRTNKMYQELQLNLLNYLLNYQKFCLFVQKLDIYDKM